jgi:anti-anti-sigma factor
MKSRKVLNSEIATNTFVVTPLRHVSEFTEESVSEELKLIRQEFREKQAKNVVFDFQTVEKISSAMLEILLTMKREVDESHGKIACCNLRPSGREVLKLSCFDTFLAICESRQEALAAVEG